MTHSAEKDAIAEALRLAAWQLSTAYSDRDIHFAIDFLRESADQYALDEPSVIPPGKGDAR